MLRCPQEAGLRVSSVTSTGERPTREAMSNLLSGQFPVECEILKCAYNVAPTSLEHSATICPLYDRGYE